MAYLPNDKDVAQHNEAANNHNNATLLPVWGLISRVEHDTPERIQGQGEDVHAIDCHTADRVVASALKNNACPAKDQRVDHVRRAGQVEGEEGSSKGKGRDQEHNGADKLQEDSQHGHGDAGAGSVHMPSGQHVGRDTDGLHTEWVGVDLALSEVRRLVLQPDEEVVLNGIGLKGSADGRPENQDPTR